MITTFPYLSFVLLFIFYHYFFFLSTFLRFISMDNITTSLTKLLTSPRKALCITRTITLAMKCEWLFRCATGELERILQVGAQILNSVWTVR